MIAGLQLPDDCLPVAATFILLGEAYCVLVVVWSFVFNTLSMVRAAIQEAWAARFFLCRLIFGGGNVYLPIGVGVGCFS